MQVASPTAVSADKRVLIFVLLELIGVKIDTFLGISNKRTRFARPQAASHFSCLSGSNQQRQVDPKGPSFSRADRPENTFSGGRPQKRSAAPCGAAPACDCIARRGRDSNSWYAWGVRRFSKPVVSATHPPLQSFPAASKLGSPFLFGTTKLQHFISFPIISSRRRSGGSCWRRRCFPGCSRIRRSGGRRRTGGPSWGCGPWRRRRRRRSRLRGWRG